MRAVGVDRACTSADGQAAGRCNGALVHPDGQVMDDQPPQPEQQPRRPGGHLRLVRNDEVPSVPVRDDVPSGPPNTALSAPMSAGTAPRPIREPRQRTIGRLIAQTALIADSALARRRHAPVGPDLRGGGLTDRLLGRFR